MVESLERLLSPAERAAVRAPIEAASPFPPIAYTSQAYFDLEVPCRSGRWPGQT